MIIRFLKVIAPYVAVVIVALVIFAAGAYCGVNVISSISNRKIGDDQFLRSIEDHSVLLLLDQGDVQKARALLALREDGNILALDSVAPFARDDRKIAACHHLQKIAEWRESHAEIYSRTTTADERQVRQAVSETLAAPASCAKEAGK